AQAASLRQRGCGAIPSKKEVCRNCTINSLILRHILGCASSPTFLRSSFAEPSLKVRWGTIMNFEF
ncbi:hypothetical protein, partial [Capnocytophaga sp. oral taxon 332]|uniref:hypothetical protein n=1 Tax=Capnocytophaga sp. oral taxon 332 TaxID=712213 RepID=UPI001E2C1051